MTKKKTGLAAALASKIGRLCHFTHPDTGEVIEGTYGRGRTVTRIVGMKREEGTDGSRSYNVDEQIFTVPSFIRISFRPAPRKDTTDGATSTR